MFRGHGNRERHKRRERPPRRERHLRGLLLVGWCGFFGLLAGANLEGESGATLATGGFMTTLFGGVAYAVRLVVSWLRPK